MTPEQAAALRAPFPPEQIGKKPQPYTKDSPKGNCGECGQRHGLPAMHLSYAGHAAVTDRLLSVDPDWTWEPMAVDPTTGAPLTVGGDLWIKMTVCGVTRIGVGDGQNSKERIGDAIRNAAMRFGVGLDLWAKESLTEGQHEASGGDVGREKQQARMHRLDIASLAERHGWDLDVLQQEFMQTHGTSTSAATAAALEDYLATLRERAEAAAPDPEPPPEPTLQDVIRTTSAVVHAASDAPPETTAEPPPERVHPTKKDTDTYRAELLLAETKAEVRAIMRGFEMDGLGDAQVGDADGVLVDLRVLAQRRLKECK